MNSKALWYLEGVDLFGRFCSVKTGDSDALHRPQTYKSGELIYIPDNTAHSIFIIKEGRVRIANIGDDGKQLTKAILREGEIFGEMIMTGEMLRVEYAESMDNNTSICEIDWHTIQQLMLTDAGLSLRILKWMGFRLQRLERKIELLTFKDARTRIIEFLKDSVAFKGTKVGEEWMLKTKLTHEDIASLTATSRQTVSDVLNDLRREDQIFFERGKILFRNIDAIK